MTQGQSTGIESVKSKCEFLLEQHPEQTTIDHKKHFGDILYCSCQEGKRKNIIFYKNGKLENPSGFGNTLPVESYDRFAFNSTNLSPMTNSESQRYQYPVCHTLVTTQHPLSRFQSSARGPALSRTRSPMSLNVGSRALSSKMIK